MCYKEETQILRGPGRQVEERLGVSLSDCSSVSVEGTINFIGVNKTHPKELITYFDRQMGSFTFPFNIYCILLYFNNNRFYAFLGREEGKLIIG